MHKARAGVWWPDLPICAVYDFEDDGDRLAGERIYYDRATVLNQLGVMHEPESQLGRVMTALTHPLTMGRALARKVRSRTHGGPAR